MVKEKKVRNYILYALGEIILVMVGILLALQVNNWNENRKAKAQLNTIIKTVREDLKTDTLIVANIIKFYDTINKYSTKVITNQITTKNIDSFPMCRSLTSIYQPMTIQKKGYKLLENYSESRTVETDSLITSVSQFYSLFDALIDNNNDLVKTEVLENLNYFKKQPWFVQWMQGQMNEDIRRYFGESQDYKNRVAANNIMATSNHQALLKQYKINAEVLLKEIDLRFNDK